MKTITKVQLQAQVAELQAEAIKWQALVYELQAKIDEGCTPAYAIDAALVEQFRHFV